MKHTTPILICLLMLLILVLGSCSSTIDSYDSGINQMKELQAKYQADFQKAPIKESIPSLVSELKSLDSKIIENEDTLALNLVLDYRIHSLESDRLLLEGFKWGEASTTDPGFGCRKGGERILNSSKLRVASSEEGRLAIEPLQKLIDSYPEKSSSLNLTQRTILSLNTNYAIVQKQAQKDRNTLEGFCKDKIIITEVEGGYHVTEVDGVE